MIQRKEVSESPLVRSGDPPGIWLFCDPVTPPALLPRSFHGQIPVNVRITDQGQTIFQGQLMGSFPVPVSVTNLYTFYLSGFDEFNECLIPGTITILIFGCPPGMVPEYEGSLLVGGGNPSGRRS